MNCPKCDKLLSNQIKNMECDGGIIFNFHCPKCKSDFEAFIDNFDLEEKFDIIQD